MKVFFPGSFRPFTKGHHDIVTRLLSIFDEEVVGIGVNEQKAQTDDHLERKAAIETLFAHEERVSVVCYSTLTITCAKEVGAKVIVKGVRSVKDYEYEREQAEVNRMLGIETLLLPATPELACISSSVVRELQHFGQDVTQLLP